MTDFSKYDMSDIWASAGDVVAPDSAKIAAGWGVEVVPRQWWNWFENRQDNNIAYLLQKGIPEWDSVTEYQINRSFVQLGGIVYKALTTSTNIDPSTSPANWARAFADYSASSAALGGLTLAANTFPYFTGTSSATTTALSPFARTILDDVDASAVRSTISAQSLNNNLTALSGAAAGVNALPYFNSGTTMTTTTLTSFARSLLAAVDAPSARTTLGVYSTTETDAAITASVTTRQPLDATLTTLASLTTAVNTMPYFTGTDVAAVTTLTAFARTLLDDTDASAARTTLGVPAIADVQPIDATLTAIAALTTAADTLPYFTGVDAVTTTPLTIFARSLLDDADAATARATLGAQPTDATLTALAAVTTAADTLVYATGVDAFSTTSLTGYARSLLDDVDAPAARTTLGLPLTTSNIDGTAGRVTKVGDFGLGGLNVAITSTDLNALNKTGFYMGSNLTNSPGGVGWYYIIHQEHGASGFSSQVAIELGNSAAERIYARRKVAGSWTAWKEIALLDSPSFTGTPTAPTAAAGTNTTQLASTAFVNAAINAAPVLGISQSWQDVTSSRAVSTTYTNSTGKPITVSVAWTCSSALQRAQLTVGGVVANIGATAGSGGVTTSATAVVPPGATYSCQNVGGGTVSSLYWSELR